MPECVGPSCGTGGWTGPQPGDPDSVATLTATAVWGGIELAWTMPATNPFAVAYTQIYRSLSNNFAAAIPLAIEGGNTYVDRQENGETFWYWIRFVSIHGTQGDLIGPASATAGNYVQGLLDRMVGNLSENQLVTALRTKIDQIALLQVGLDGEVADRLLAEGVLQSALSAVQGEVNTYKTLVDTEVVQRIAADGAMAAQIDVVAVGVGDNAAAIVVERNASISRDDAIAADVTLLTTRVDDAEASILEENLAWTTATNALASRATSLEAKVNLTEGQTVTGLINVVATAQANDNAARVTEITTLQSRLNSGGDIANRIASVETTSSTTVERVGVVEAQHTIKVQARSDGQQVIAGIGLNATIPASGPAQSQLVLMADRVFAVASQADLNATPQPLWVSGIVDGVNTFVVPATRIGDKNVSARMIVDGGIEARNLKVIGGSASALNPDPTCADVSAWYTNGPNGTLASAVVSNGVVGRNVLRITDSYYAESKTPFSVRAGKTYRVRCWARKTNGTGFFYLRTVGYDATGAQVTDYQLTAQAGFASSEGHALPGSTWVEFSSSWGPVPSNVVSAKVRVYGNNTGTGVTEVQDVRVEEMLDWSVVINGGLKADNIDTRNLTIKDGAGNVIFGSGQNLDWTRLAGVPNSVYKNLLDPSVWVSGTSGSQGSYAHYGNTNENNIELLAGPDGTLTPAWKATSQDDNTSTADGGFDSPFVSIDKTKMYRYAVWYRPGTGTSGNVYLGPGGYSLASNPERRVETSAGVAEGNPYFVSHARTFFGQRWYLLVGYIHPAGTTVFTGKSGAYDSSTGQRAVVGNEYRWGASATTQRLRAFQFYCDTGDTGHFCGPRIDICDGTEPSIEQLMAPTGFLKANWSGVTGAGKPVDYAGQVVDGQRSTNPQPQAWTVGEVFHFKESSALGVTGAPGYGVLRTVRPYGSGSDLSGGQVFQWFESDGFVWARRSTSATAWSAWEAVPNGTITSANISTYIAAAAIGWAQIGNLVISSDGAIRSGQTAWNTGNGWWLGFDTGQPKFSIGDPAGSYMRWDPTNGLVIKTNAISPVAAPKAVMGNHAADSGRIAISGSITCTATIQFRQDGSIKTLSNGSGSTITTDAGVWFDPVGGTPGNDYDIYFTRTSGTSTGFTNGAPTWAQLNATREITLSFTSSGQFVYEAYGTYAVRRRSDGVQIGTGAWQLYIERAF